MVDSDGLVSSCGGSVDHPILLAGYPVRYPDVYHKVRVLMGDMAVHIDFGAGEEPVIFVRNIERPRTQKQNPGARVYCPEDYAPAGGLDSNRNIGFAQAAGEYLQRRGVKRVTSDQMLPLLFVDVFRELGIDVFCDRVLGILERRAKDAREIAQLVEAQRVTEEAIRYAYGIIRDAEVRDGLLIHGGEVLTSEELRSEITLFLLHLGFANDDSIAAGGVSGSDCHFAGSGGLRINEPIIIDVFPTSKESRYSGDCTRTICRGEISPILREMHEAVVEAKAASIGQCYAGNTGAAVHAASVEVFMKKGYHIGMPGEGDGDDVIFYPHGTGHGVGLETHEPPILDEKNDEGLVVGDALTIEPGLYCKAVGGVRVEDMVIVEAGSCRNLNKLPEGLWWE